MWKACENVIRFLQCPIFLLQTLSFLSFLDCFFGLTCLCGPMFSRHRLYSWALIAKWFSASWHLARKEAPQNMHRVRRLQVCREPLSRCSREAGGRDVLVVLRLWVRLTSRLAGETACVWLTGIRSDSLVLIWKSVSVHWRRSSEPGTFKEKDVFCDVDIRMWEHREKVQIISSTEGSKSYVSLSGNINEQIN